LRPYTIAVAVAAFPQAPATFSLLAYTELCDGVWYAMGGLHTVPQSLARVVRQLGAAVRYGAAVRAVRTDGACVRGVELEGGEAIEADVVVASADLPCVARAARVRRIRSHCAHAPRRAARRGAARRWLRAVPGCTAGVTRADGGP
jgi:phytoene dehydrogenase-like protein